MSWSAGLPSLARHLNSLSCLSTKAKSQDFQTILSVIKSLCKWGQLDCSLGRELATEWAARLSMEFPFTRLGRPRKSSRKSKLTQEQLPGHRYGNMQHHVLCDLSCSLCFLSREQLFTFQITVLLYRLQKMSPPVRASLVRLSAQFLGH